MPLKTRQNNHTTLCIIPNSCETVDDCDDLDDELLSEYERCDESGGESGGDGFDELEMKFGGGQCTIRGMRSSNNGIGYRLIVVVQTKMVVALSRKVGHAFFLFGNLSNLNIFYN